MNQDDIIRMARGAGIRNDCDGIWCEADQLHHFANLVAAAEREACADLCSNILNQCGNRDYGYWEGVTDCSAAIRARGVGDGT